MLKRIGIVITAAALSVIAPGSGQVLNNQNKKAVLFAVIPWLALLILFITKPMWKNPDIAIVVGGTLVGVMIIVPAAAAIEAGIVAYRRSELAGVWGKLFPALLFAFIWILLMKLTTKNIRQALHVPYYKPGTMTIDSTRK